MKQIHYSKLLVDQAVSFLKDGVCPSLSRNQILRFKKRFLNGSYSVKWRQLICDGKPVVDQDSIPDVLKQMYSFPEVSREGILSFFDQIRQRYQGILGVTLKSSSPRKRLISGMQRPSLSYLSQRFCTIQKRPTIWTSLISRSTNGRISVTAMF